MYGVTFGGDDRSPIVKQPAMKRSSTIATGLLLLLASVSVLYVEVAKVQMQRSIQTNGVAMAPHQASGAAYELFGNLLSRYFIGWVVK